MAGGKTPVDGATVKRIARLARLGIAEVDLTPMARELTVILDWVAELDTLDTANVPPMTSVEEVALKRRPDEVTDGFYAEDVVRNAPEKIDSYFAVPKVVE